MSDRAPERIAVIGAGSIGVAWAIIFARAGHQVDVHEIDPNRLSAIPAEIRTRVEGLVEHGLAAADNDIPGRISLGSDLAAAVARAGYIQECTPESVDAKRAMFGQLDAMAPADTVLASSSSMIACSRFAAELPGRARCLVVHPGNPPYLLPVAELVPAPFTDPAVVQRARDLLTGAGMVTIDVHAEVEGFVFNRLQGALLREAYALVAEGVVSPTDVDRIVQLGLGLRWSVLGPFATADLNARGGLERHAAVLGPAYARMGAQRGSSAEAWPSNLVARVADELHRNQPLEDWSERVEQRDHALMVLLAARQAAGLE